MTPLDPAPSPIRRLIVSGKVQGVGFRWFVRERARRLGVAGWVRNEMDGRVQILVGGPLELVERFMGEVHVGPPNAVVDAVDELDASDHNEQARSGAHGTSLPYPFEIRK